MLEDIRLYNCERNGKALEIRKSSPATGICHALGLSLFCHKLFRPVKKGRPLHEDRKIAICWARTTAMLALIHFIPVGVAVGISSLNWAGMYIGISGQSGMDQEELAGLLFAAKLHELTNTTSLASLLCFNVRHEMGN